MQPPSFIVAILPDVSIHSSSPFTTPPPPRCVLVFLLTAVRATARPVHARAAPIAFARPRTRRGTHPKNLRGVHQPLCLFFQSVQDLFELQRGLNNCFAHDLVARTPPSSRLLFAHLDGWTTTQQPSVFSKAFARRWRTRHNTRRILMN